MSENTVTHLPLKSTMKEPVSGAPAQAANYDSIPLAKMQPGERIEAFMQSAGRYSLHRDSDALYQYDGSIWRLKPDSHIKSELAAFYTSRGFKPGAGVFDNDLNALKVYSSFGDSPAMGEPAANVIAFANGVYSIIDGSFSSHCAENWLRSHNGVHYHPAEAGESLEQNAQNFNRWLNHASGEDGAKRNAILAALYMVLAKRYDWQMFFEVTGPGGGGKSIFMNLCKLLAGEESTATTTLRDLCNPMMLTHLVDASLVLMPDQPKYHGDSSTLKAMTGGDAVLINPKHRPPYSAVIRAVVIVVTNEPAVFNEHNGGISRRRVLLQFKNVVSDQDTTFMDKLRPELPVIIRYLLSMDAADAQNALREQRDSMDAFEAKADSSSLYGFAAHLELLPDAHGMLMGNRPLTTNDERPREYLYHAYLCFMEVNGYERPMSRPAFAKSLPSVMKEKGWKVESLRVKAGYRYNLTLADSADDWLP
ncbi:nucleoside triphosphatase [Escherichia coli]|nr:nucleoside triphosphatase [Escherichia coli]